MNNVWKSRAVKVALLCGVPVALCGPAGAGEVRVQGTAVFFTAKAGEVNTVFVRHIDDDVQVTDSTTRLFPVAPCAFVNEHEVSCTVENVSFISLDLGNGNDKVSQAEVSSTQSIPMKIFGGLGNDILSGSFQQDTIDGGPGTDVIDGSDGDDVITGGAGDDQILGGRGNDIIDGQVGDDTIDGGIGDDVIHGAVGADRITGGPGVDKLFGDAGKDILNSRDGAIDALDCGTGKDTIDRDPNDTVKHCS
jgi:Ca2+-binding RTX toxin-like protein